MQVRTSYEYIINAYVKIDTFREKKCSLRKCTYKTVVTLNFPVNNDCTHWDSGVTGRGVVLVE